MLFDTLTNSVAHQTLNRSKNTTLTFDTLINSVAHQTNLTDTDLTRLPIQ